MRQQGSSRADLPYGGENPTWGAPRIHGELMMLGFDLFGANRSALRWMRRTPQNPEPANHWKAFLSNHREAIAAMDLTSSRCRPWHSG